MPRLFLKTKKYFTTYIHLQKEERYLVLSLISWLLIGKILGRILPFRKIANLLGNQGITHCQEPTLTQQIKLKKILRVFRKITRHIPIHFSCLEQAFAFVQIIKKYKLPYLLYFGVNKDDNQQIIAHAWLKSGSINLTGCENADDFKLITTFGESF